MTEKRAYVIGLLGIVAVSAMLGQRFLSQQEAPLTGQGSAYCVADPSRSCNPTTCTAGIGARCSDDGCACIAIDPKEKCQNDPNCKVCQLYSGAWLCADIPTDDPAPICGNNVIEPPEQCDDGNVVNGDGCNADCSYPLPMCGDNNIDTGEQCDDGNVVNGDGCSSTCQTEAVCGNGGEPEKGEQCDEGDNNVDIEIANLSYSEIRAKREEERDAIFKELSKSGCLSTCQIAKCSNGVDEPDDEEDNDVDGADAACRDGDCRFQEPGDTYLKGYNSEINPCQHPGEEINNLAKTDDVDNSNLLGSIFLNETISTESFTASPTGLLNWLKNIIGSLLGQTNTRQTATSSNQACVRIFTRVDRLEFERPILEQSWITTDGVTGKCPTNERCELRGSFVEKSESFTASENTRRIGIKADGHPGVCRGTVEAGGNCSTRTDCRDAYTSENDPKITARLRDALPILNKWNNFTNGDVKSLTIRVTEYREDFENEELKIGNEFIELEKAVLAGKLDNITDLIDDLNALTRRQIKYAEDRIRGAGLYIYRNNEELLEEAEKRVFCLGEGSSTRGICCVQEFEDFAVNEAKDKIKELKLELESAKKEKEVILKNLTAARKAEDEAQIKILEEQEKNLSLKIKEIEEKDIPTAELNLTTAKKDLSGRLVPTGGNCAEPPPELTHTSPPILCQNTPQQNQPSLPSGPPPGLLNLLNSSSSSYSSSNNNDNPNNPNNPNNPPRSSSSRSSTRSSSSRSFSSGFSSFSSRRSSSSSSSQASSRSSSRSSTSSTGSTGSSSSGPYVDTSSASSRSTSSTSSEYTVTYCEEDDQCVAGEECISNQCIITPVLIGGPCTINDQCNSGKCSDNTCVAAAEDNIPDSCGNDADCPAGYACVNAQCVVQPDQIASILCGNNVVDAGEECDPPGSIVTDNQPEGYYAVCSQSCQIQLPALLGSPELCGNGLLDPGETCDDANRVSGDGCSSVCSVEDGVITYEFGQGPSVGGPSLTGNVTGQAPEHAPVGDTGPAALAIMIAGAAAGAGWVRRKIRR